MAEEVEVAEVIRKKMGHCGWSREVKRKEDWGHCQGLLEPEGRVWYHLTFNQGTRSTRLSLLRLSMMPSL